MVGCLKYQRAQPLHVEAKAIYNFTWKKLAHMQSRWCLRGGEGGQLYGRNKRQRQGDGKKGRPNEYFKWYKKYDQQISNF